MVQKITWFFEIVNLNLQNIRSILPKSCGVASLMTIFSPTTKSMGHGVTWQIIQVTVIELLHSELIHCMRTFL